MYCDHHTPTIAFTLTKWIGEQCIVSPVTYMLGNLEFFEHSQSIQSALVKITDSAVEYVLQRSLEWKPIDCK